MTEEILEFLTVRAGMQACSLSETLRNFAGSADIPEDVRVALRISSEYLSALARDANSLVADELDGRRSHLRQMIRRQNHSEKFVVAR